MKHLRNWIQAIVVIAIVALAIIALMPATKHQASLRLDEGRLHYNGTVYKGQFTGHGQLTFDNGDRYVGLFKDGRFNGRGTYTAASWTYTGEFKQGQVTGKGTLSIKGKHYQGTFKNGQYFKTTSAH